MTYVVFILSALVGCSLASYRSPGCYNVETIDRSLRDAYCDQPLFVTFLPKTEESQLLDNICYTYFPLPDDPDTFQIYYSRVFCDGSNDIASFIGTQIELGVSREANPFCTMTNYIFGYAGCDTYLNYRCFNYGDCTSVAPFSQNQRQGAILGLSPQCRTIGLSCLRKVEEIVRDNCLPDQDYYVLPMKLPNRCVTQQLCLTPPNPFYGALEPVGPVGPFVGLI